MNAVTTTRRDDLRGIADSLFRDGDWHLVQPGDGRQGAEVIHVCSREEDGRPIRWCYSWWGSPHCPGNGCDETQPDSIQTLEQFMNADVDRGRNAHISSMIDRSMKQIFWRGMKDLSAKLDKNMKDRDLI